MIKETIRRLKVTKEMSFGIESERYEQSFLERHPNDVRVKFLSEGVNDSN